MPESPKWPRLFRLVDLDYCNKGLWKTPHRSMDRRTIVRSGRTDLQHGLCGPRLGQRDQPLDRQRHFVQGCPFLRGVDQMGAVGEVRRGKSELRQARTVSAAANDRFAGRAAQSLQGLNGM